MDELEEVRALSPAPPRTSEARVPPYAGPQGWLGLRLDVEPDGDEVGEVLAEAWRLPAPKRLLAGR